MTHVHAPFMLMSLGDLVVIHILHSFTVKHQVIYYTHPMCQYVHGSTIIQQCEFYTFHATVYKPLLELQLQSVAPLVSIAGKEP